MPSLRARWTAVCLAVTILLLLPTTLPAQGTGGRILGRVADPSGAVLAHVKVVATNEATGVSRDSQSNDSGDYTFPEVPVGVYSLSFELTGSSARRYHQHPARCGSRRPYRQPTSPQLARHLSVLAVAARGYVDRGLQQQHCVRQ
jgi:hypothetical protein